MSFKNLTLTAAGAIGLIASLAAPLAVAEEANHTSLSDAIEATKPILDARLRYEIVDQDGLPNDADALTIRGRAGFETGKFYHNKVLIEAEGVTSLVSDFNSTTNGKTSYPVVADPKDIQLNRFQIVNTYFPKTRITLGRQRIILDNARFVGNVGWRQNEQTFDGVRIENESLKGFKIDSAYIRQVNRIFGTESPMGKFEGDTFYVNGKYKVPLEVVEASIGGFAYFVDLEESPLNSSKTYGVQVSLAKKPVSLKGAFAKQSDYEDNPVSYNESYYTVEGGIAHAGFSAGAGYEVLTGNGTIGFATPLATLHAFNGWADVFLTTPANGLEDLYFKAGYARKEVGPFTLVKVEAVYHEYDAENTGADYGSELDIIAVAAYKKCKFIAKYADYDSDGFATDRQKFWFGINYSY